MDAQAFDILLEIEEYDPDGLLLLAWYYNRREAMAFGSDGLLGFISLTVAGHYDLTEEEAASACLTGAPVAAVAEDWSWSDEYADTAVDLIAQGIDEYAGEGLISLHTGSVDELALDGAAITIEEARALLPKEDPSC